MKTKTRKELEDNRNAWVIVAIVFFSMFVVYSVLYDEKIDDLETQLSECQDKIPEVINGNLYIGYEDGVRIGYHQDYLNKSIWYRCARDCEVIE